MEIRGGFDAEDADAAAPLRTLHYEHGNINITLALAASVDPRPSEVSAALYNGDYAATHHLHDSGAAMLANLAYKAQEPTAQEPTSARASRRREGGQALTRVIGPTRIIGHLALPSHGKRRLLQHEWEWRGHGRGGKDSCSSADG